MAKETKIVLGALGALALMIIMITFYLITHSGQIEKSTVVSGVVIGGIAGLVFGVMSCRVCAAFGTGLIIGAPVIGVLNGTIISITCATNNVITSFICCIISTTIVSASVAIISSAVDGIGMTATETSLIALEKSSFFGRIVSWLVRKKITYLP